MAKFDPALLDEIRAAVPISEVIGRFVTWDQKKTNRSKGDWWACCVLHGERSPSFHCEDRKGRFMCFGCGASGDHFGFLMQADGATFPKAVEEVARMGGVRLPGEREETEAERRKREQRRQELARKKEADERAAQAKREQKVASAGGYWRSSRPLAGSPAAAYLAARGLPPIDEPNLRFHPAVWHEFARREIPALIGRVQGPDGNGTGIWRIFVRPDGSDKAFGKGGEFESKLGFGPAKGGAVRLGGEGNRIGIGEGIETCLAARLLGNRLPIWAALSTSGMQSFEPPPGVRQIVVFPDGDKPRRRNGIDYGPPGMVAAAELRARMLARGIACEIAEPPPIGKDYLDLYVWSQENA